MSALYTVVEGYKELGLKNDAIDKLIQHAAVDRLRLLRNGTFHYQRRPDKLVQFFAADSADVEWAERLHAAFDQFERDYRVEVTVRNMMAARP